LERGKCSVPERPAWLAKARPVGKRPLTRSSPPRSKRKSDEPAANRDGSLQPRLVPWAARPKRIQRASPERHPLSLATAPVMAEQRSRHGLGHDGRRSAAVPRTQRIVM